MLLVTCGIVAKQYSMTAEWQIHGRLEPPKSSRVIVLANFVQDVSVYSSHNERMFVVLSKSAGKGPTGCW